MNTPASFENAETFRALIENGLDIISVLAPDGTIRYESPSIRRLLGYTPEELVGQNVFEYVHPDDRQKVIKAFALTLNESSPVVEFRFRHSDGNWKVLEAIGRNLTHDPVVAGVVVNSRDVSERHNVQESLRISEERLRTVVTSAPVIIWALDAQGRFLLSEGSGLQAMNLKPGELVGQSVFEAYRDKPEVVHDAQRALAGETVRSVVEVNGVYFDSKLSPVFDAMGRVNGVIGVATDVTELRHAERHRAARHAVTHVLAEADSFEEAMPLVLEAIGTNLHWKVGTLWRVVEGADTLSCDALWSIDAEPEQFTALREYSFARGVGLPGRVWAEGEPAWIVDVVHDVNFPRVPVAIQSDLHSAFAFPILAGGVVIGVVEFFSHEIRQPDDDLLEMVATIGNQLGQFLERKRAEAALRASEARKGAILETALDCIIGMDHEGNVTEFNPAAEKTFGYAREDVMGLPLADFIIPERLRDHHYRGLQHYLATGEGPVLSTRIEVPGLHADGHEFPVELAITRVPVAGAPSFTAYLRDITARVEAEAALKAARDEAEKAREEAEAANQAKSGFLSRMSHELRTPLNAILGFSQLLQMDPLEPEQQEGVGHVIKAGRHLLDLINEVLDIARIEAGELSISAEPICLREILTEAIDLAQPMANMRDITIGFAPHFKNESWYVFADRQRTRQILLNLLSNAIKYNRTGGSITIDGERKGDRSLIHITDTGIGIAPEKMGRLFSAFDRLGAERTEVEGTGLGLSLSQSLMQAMGGSISAHSKPGEGSTFTIDLPTAKNPLEGLAEPETAHELPGQVPDLRYQILYIEDNASNLRLMERILAQRPGIKLLVAMQGGLGLELAREHRPNLICLDLHLPDIQGDAILKRLREDTQTRNTPVIVVSADATDRQIERLMAPAGGYPGAQRYMTKPLEVQSFLRVVDELLAEGQLN